MTLFMHKYSREDSIRELEKVTSTHENRRPVNVWICDCGCDAAQWLQRTAKGMAWTSQVWEPDDAPKVVVFETFEEIEQWLASMKYGPGGSSSIPQTDKWLGRYESFCRWAWSVWYDN